jgi:splicing factor U2AF subunit
MYPGTPETMQVSNDEDWDDATYNKAQEHCEMFFEEVFLELSKYGEVEDMVVCDNVSEHMVGNVYVKYVREDDAEKAQLFLGKRFYGAKLLQVEFSPVTDFREARCKAFHETRCARGGLCNFMHVKHIPKTVKRRVVRDMFEEHPEFTKNIPQGVLDEQGPKKKQKQAVKRMGSEERKTMIAQWNKERMTALQVYQPGSAVPVPPPGMPVPVPPPAVPVPPPAFTPGLIKPPPAAVSVR